MLTTWIYNSDIRFFDLTEAGCLRRLKQALEGFRRNRSQYDTADRDLMTCQCGIYEKFFDEIFGDGSGIQICGKEKSAETHARAFLDFVAFLQDQITALDKMCAEADRRAQKWKKCLRRDEENDAQV